MPNPAKQIVLGAALLVGTTMVTNADPLTRTDGKSAASGAAVPSGARQLSGNEVSALPPSDATPRRDSVALPGVSVVAPSYSHPYTSGMGPKVSSNGRIRAEHYQAPPDYVTDIAMQRRGLEGRSKLQAEVRALRRASGLQEECRNAPLFERPRAADRIQKSCGRRASQSQWPRIEDWPL